MLKKRDWRIQRYILGTCHFQSFKVMNSDDLHKETSSKENMDGCRDAKRKGCLESNQSCSQIIIIIIIIIINKCWLG